MKFHYFELNKSQVKEVVNSEIPSFYFKLRTKPDDFRPVRVRKSTNITHMRILFNKSYENFLEYKLLDFFNHKIMIDNANYHVIFFKYVNNNIEYCRSIEYAGEINLPIDEKITNKFETMKIFG